MYPNNPRISLLQGTGLGVQVSAQTPRHSSKRCCDFYMTLVNHLLELPLGDKFSCICIWGKCSGHHKDQKGLCTVLILQMKKVQHKETKAFCPGSHSQLHRQEHNQISLTHPFPCCNEIKNAREGHCKGNLKRHATPEPGSGRKQAWILRQQLDEIGKGQT